MKAQPTARTAGFLIGCVLLGAGIVTGHDALVLIGLCRSTTTWIGNAIGILQQPTSTALLYGYAAIAALVALVLIIIAFKPRRTTHLCYSHHGSELWLTPLDMARMLTSLAQRVPGVSSAHSVVSTKSAVVRIRSTYPDEELSGRVQSALEQYTAATTPPLSLRVVASTSEKEQ